MRTDTAADTADVTVTVNGEPRTIAGGSTVYDLLAAMDLDPDDARGVAVAVGDEVVRRQAWRETVLPAGAHVEVLTARQGG